MLLPLHHQTTLQLHITQHSTESNIVTAFLQHPLEKLPNNLCLRLQYVLSLISFSICVSQFNSWLWQTDVYTVKYEYNLLSLSWTLHNTATRSGCCLLAPFIAFIYLQLSSASIDCVSTLPYSLHRIVSD